jgi:hypothetical protein
MANYKIYKYKPDDEDSDASWDAEDWCWIVTTADDEDDIVCICATEGEAQHIHALLEEKPYGATSTASQ